MPAVSDDGIVVFPVRVWLAGQEGGLRPGARSWRDRRAVKNLEARVTRLEALPGRIDSLELQIVQLRGEMREEFSAVRVEMRVQILDLKDETRRLITEGDNEIRREMAEQDAQTRRQMIELNEDTRRHMLVLHEEVIGRLALLQEGQSEPRRRRRRKP